MLKNNVLVSGAAGFIGSHFSESLLSKGYRVIGVDNLVTGDISNIQSYRHNPDFEFFELDLNDPLPSFPTVDFIVHLASPASPVDFSRIPVEIMLVNSIGSRRLLEIARNQNARFILASTSEIYGEPEQHPQPEDYRGNVNPIGPRSCYDESKRFAEAMTVAYRRRYSVSTGIVRIFNTYGPRMRKDDGRVVPNFICQALDNQPITIYGDGKQTRSFCYVSDLVDGVFRLMNSDFPGPVNIGNPEEHTILEIAGKIKALADSASQLSFNPLPVDDPTRRKPDITLAKKMLSWEPRIHLDEGLKLTLDWFKKKAAALL